MMRCKENCWLPATLALFIGLAISCKTEESTPELAANQISITGIKPSYLAKETFIGVVVADRRTDILAQVSGKIQEVSVELGDDVKEGQIIAVIDSQVLLQEFNAAQAALQAAEADQARTRVRLTESKEKFKLNRALAGTISRAERRVSQLDVRRARSELKISDAKVSEMRARYEEAKVQLANTVIRAPFAGRIAVHDVQENVFVSPSDRIVRLITSNELKIRFAIPQNEATNFRMGSVLSVRLSDSESVLSAKVIYIASEIDTHSGLVIGEASLPAQNSGIRAGQTLRVWNPKAGELQVELD